MASIRLGPDGMRWSPGVYALLGLDADAFQPSLQLLLSFVHPDDAGAQTGIEELVAGRGGGPVRFRLVPRGRPVIRADLLPLEADADSAGGRRLCLLDGTGQDDVRREIARARETVSACLEGTSDAMLLLDEGGGVVAGNAAAHRLFALGPEPRGSLWERIPTLVGDPIWRFAQAGSEPAHLTDERWVPALGRWLAYTLVRIDGGLLCVFRDRDEVFRLRASLADVSERWRGALRGAGASLFDVEADPDRDDAAGRTDLDAAVLRGRLRPAERARLRAEQRAAAAERRALAIDLPCATTGATLRLRAAHLPAEAGRPPRFVGMLLADDSAAGSVPPGTGTASRAVTGAQVRAARGALRWSVRELAAHSEVSVATINRFEADVSTVAARDRSVAALRDVLAAHGIAFLEMSGRPAIAIGAVRVEEDGKDAPSPRGTSLATSAA